jgi:lysyl-tRNA synthetase class 1
MIWVDREVKKIKEQGHQSEWVDDMKTPSGRIHVGALRGVVIHDLVYKVLLENKIKATYTYIFDDHDPMDAIPSYLDYQKWEKYAGMQLYQIPSPVAGYKSYAQYYAQEFTEVFNSINCHPKIIWASELYNSGKMNTVIKEVLDAAPKIREIYARITKNPKPDYWYPFNVRCEKCGKIGTTQVYRWDGQYVYYRCVPRLVGWATGCGHEGKASPFNGNGKFPWKVDWAAKWKVIGVTIEGAGKDHMSKGGSHDIASAIVKEVLNYPVPYPLPYEWFTTGGKKMSSSKGIGSSAKEIASLLPPTVLRFLIVRKPINQHVDFTPTLETMSHLFDDYDTCLSAYFDYLENKLPSGKKGEVYSDFVRIIQLSQVEPLPKKRLFLPRFRLIVNLILQKNKNIEGFFSNLKKSPLTKEEKTILEERIKYAKNFIEKYFSQKEEKSPDIKLNETQKTFIVNLAKKLEETEDIDNDKIKNLILNTIKESNLNTKDGFSAFYLAVIGKPFGPKAVDLINDLGIKEVIKRLKKI